MLNFLIRFSLKNRVLVIALALLVLLLGIRTGMQLPVEVLPDMTKPTVTVLTEAPGLAPEEVEILVTRPLENSLLGIGGLDRLRSNSDVGLSLDVAMARLAPEAGPSRWARLRRGGADLAAEAVPEVARRRQPGA